MAFFGESWREEESVSGVMILKDLKFKLGFLGVGAVGSQKLGKRAFEVLGNGSDEC
jgi:hypothetical protein